MSWTSFITRVWWGWCAARQLAARKLDVFSLFLSQWHWHSCVSFNRVFSVFRGRSAL